MDISSRCHAGGDVLVDELESNLGKFVRIGNVPEPSASDEGDDSHAEDCEVLESFGPEPVKKCLRKCATFPCGSKMSDEGSDGPEMSLRLLFCEEPMQLPFSHSKSMPLMSAMKGSREKQGLFPKILNVTWAPDVYDPIPNSVSHIGKGKQKKSRKAKDRDNNFHNKKNGKKGPKGNPSKGGSKDKKQFHKPGGRSEKCYKTMDTPDVDDPGGLDVGSPDYFESSFLKKSPARLHNVAEAL
uniref:Uncharacterized protein n=1 Tax=Rhizophora mucronata TaxID=61149 RepID=A0A2P2LYR1_RHIMU